MPIFSACRRQSCRKDRSTLSCPAIISIGIMRKERIFRYGPVYQRGADFCSLWYRNRRTDTEGRVITAEFPEYFVVTVYTPNSQDELKRLAYRMEWEDAFLSYLKGLEQEKPVIFCGDLNVAATEMDIKNAKANEKNAGFTKEEREKFAVIKEKGFVDSFRMLYPDTVTYSWWSYRFQARQRNAGWRLDYFMVSESLKDAVADAKIHTEILGSDHCPVELDLEV